ncbi:MAG TPA: insulinase family protein, partial [Kofleriaceae bacterium]|nr:insulinase family protein [Kofleriaceae bacterium]
YALGGGAFSSRLMKVVRVEGGKTYGASSSFDRNLDKGSFVASTFTRNAEAVATTKLILGEIAKMAKDGPTQAEVDAAIANIAGGYGMRFQAAADLGAALVGAELHGFGVEYLANFPLVVGKVNVEDAKRAASEILDPRNYVVVMVGDAKDLEPQLQKAGWHYEKMSYAEQITKEIKAPAPPADAKQITAAKQLLGEALAAKGKKLSTVKALRMQATGTTKIQGQELPVEIERVIVVPDHMKIEATLAKQFKVTIAVDGKSGWQQQPTQTGTMQTVEFKDDQITQAQFEVWRDPDMLLAKAADPNVKVTGVRDETIDGKPHTAVTIASPFGPDLTLYIDKKTKLLSRTSFEDGGVTQTEDFSDYKDDGGIKTAHKRSSSGQGRSTSLEITKVEWDPKIDPAIFKKPAK